jgi:hypothetical protein
MDNFQPAISANRRAIYGRAESRSGLAQPGAKQAFSSSVVSKHPSKRDVLVRKFSTSKSACLIINIFRRKKWYDAYGRTIFADLTLNPFQK